jgi:hypothetical protein
MRRRAEVARVAVLAVIAVVTGGLPKVWPDPVAGATAASYQE